MALGLQGLRSPGADPLGLPSSVPPLVETDDEVVDNTVKEYQQEPGLLGSVLRYVDRPGQIVRNVLTGNPLSAAKQLGDIALETIDAFLPGDWIPAVTSKQDYVSGSDLLAKMGLKSNAEDPWYQRWATGLAGFAVDVATDPLSYLSFGGVGLVKSAAAKGLARKAGVALTDDVLKGVVRAGSFRKAAKEATRLGKLAHAAEKAGVTMSDDVLRFASHADDLAKVSLMEPVARYGIPFGPKVKIPVTYGQLVPKLKALIDPVASRTPKFIRDFGRKFALNIRSGFGNLEPEGMIAVARRSAEGVSSAVGKVEMDRLLGLFDDVALNSNMDRAISAAMHNAYKDPKTGKWLTLVPDKFDMPGIGRRADEAARVFGVSAEAVAQKAEGISDLMAKALKNRKAYGTSLKAAEDYFPRVIRGLPKSYDPAKSRAMRFDELVDVLNQHANEGMDMVDSAYTSLATRVAKDQHNIFRRQMFDGLFGPQFMAKHEGATQVIGAIADDLVVRDPQMAKYLTSLAKKELPDNFMVDVLAANNLIFKPAATMGLFLPRMMFNTRNRLSAIWQRASVEGGEWLSSANPKSVLKDLCGSIFDGLRSIGFYGKRASVGKEGKWLAKIDDVFREAAGDYGEVRRLLGKGGKYEDDMLLAAVENGVTQGYVASEGIVNAWAKAGPGYRKKVRDFMRWPAVVTQSMEGRMRLAMFDQLFRKYGGDAAKAAKKTADAMLDYSMLKGGPGYNLNRQLFPFLAFTAQSIPQQAKFLLREPAVAVALASIFGDPKEPVMPWIAEQPSIRLGDNSAGETLYLTGFGMPVEALNFIPQFSGSPREFGTDIEKQIVGSTHPLLKYLYGLTSKRDPFFGTTFGSYSRTPAALQALGAPKESELSRLYNEYRQTGLLQPIESALQQFNVALDPRYTPGAKALRLLTGARISASNPNLATLQILQRQLEQDPRAQTYRTYVGGSEEAQAAIKALSEARKALKRQRQLASQ